MKNLLALSALADSLSEDTIATSKEAAKEVIKSVVAANMEAIAKLNKLSVFDVVLNDKKSPMRGVYYDGATKCAIACNGKVLYINPEEYDDSRKGKIYDFNDNEVDGQFFNYNAILSGKPMKIEVQSKEWLINDTKEAEAIAKLEGRTYGVVRLSENIYKTCCISTEVMPYLLWAGTDGWEEYDKGICKVMQNGAKLFLVKCV